MSDGHGFEKCVPKEHRAGRSFNYILKYNFQKYVCPSIRLFVYPSVRHTPICSDFVVSLQKCRGDNSKIIGILRIENDRQHPKFEWMILIKVV
jgi:hypothetical protein